MSESPITVKEGAKILGCTEYQLICYINEGKIKRVKRNAAMNSESFRAFCKDQYGIDLERVPEWRTDRRQPKLITNFSKKAMKRMKRSKRTR
jgi:hypothetical protein